jgi:uncharacterized LabA/DUF88 family protein
VPVDRAAIFIDAGYLEKVIEKELNRIRIDYGKFASEISGGHEVLRTYFYNCPPYQSNPPTLDESERTANADRFYTALRRLPRFEVRLGRLEKRSCRSCGAIDFRQKRADLMLGVDLVNLSAKEQISTAILVAGDSDLLPAVLVAKESGVLVHLFHGGDLNPPHRDLFDACDDRTLLSLDLMERVAR